MVVIFVDGWSCVTLAFLKIILVLGLLNENPVGGITPRPFYSDRLLLTIFEYQIDSFGGIGA